MGKRGPKARGGYDNKTATLSTRITGELRTALERSAEESGRSLSSEIERRLRRSFDYDRDIRAMFGSDETYAFMRTIAEVVNVTSTQAGVVVRKARRRPVSWLTDPYIYNQATKAALAVVELLRPPGDPVRPRLPGEGSDDQPNVLTQMVEVLGEGFSWGPGYALHFLRAVRDATGEVPLPNAPDDDRMKKLAKHVAADLGSVRDRLQKRLQKKEERE